MYKSVISIFMFASFSLSANQSDVLTVDRAVSQNIEFAFSNDKDEKPKSSDFKLVNYVIMSNESGERWAVLTLTNTSSGNRILEHDHIMATFADGERKSPQALKLSFDGRETQSLTVSFGESKFPILSIKASPQI